MKAFGDTWNWAGAAAAWADFPDLCPNAKVIEPMRGSRNTFHLHRVLKPNGSLYSAFPIVECEKVCHPAALN